MASYNITVQSLAIAEVTAVLLKVGFGDPADNSTIVKDAKAALESALPSDALGPLVLVNGPASLPVAMVICHSICHRFGAVGVFDPKMAAYVVAITHDPRWAVGDVLTT